VGITDVPRESSLRLVHLVQREIVCLGVRGGQKRFVAEKRGGEQGEWSKPGKKEGGGKNV